MARDLRFSYSTPDGMAIFERNVEVAGIQHRIDAAVCFARRGHQSISLAAERRNEYDPNAIRVIGRSKGWFLWRQHFIGYLPKDTAKRIADKDLFDVVEAHLTNIWHGGYQKDFIVVRLDILMPAPLKEKLKKKKKNTE